MLKEANEENAFALHYFYEPFVSFVANSNSIIPAVEIHQAQLFPSGAIFIRSILRAKTNAPAGRNHLCAHLVFNRSAKRGVGKINLLDRFLCNFFFVQTEPLRQIATRSKNYVLFTR